MKKIEIYIHHQQHTTKTSSIIMDLLAYYERHNITDFPKRTNGTPDMRKAFNKRHHASLLFLHPSAPNEVQSKSQMECPICYEKLEKGKGKVVLGCEHTFCIDCFTKFMHQNNTCPMCRDTFTDRSFQPMDEEYINDLVDAMLSMNMWKIEYRTSNETQQVNATQMVWHNLTHMSAFTMKDTVEIFVKAMERQCSMVATNVRNYYESQLFR